MEHAPKELKIEYDDSTQREANRRLEKQIYEMGLKMDETRSSLKKMKNWKPKDNSELDGVYANEMNKLKDKVLNLEAKEA